MSKKLLKLTEKQLHNIVSESVKKIIMEYNYGAEFANALKDEAQRLKGVVDAMQNANHLPNNQYVLKDLKALTNKLFTYATFIEGDTRGLNIDLWDGKSVDMYNSGLKPMEYHDTMVANAEKNNPENDEFMEYNN